MIKHFKYIYLLNYDYQNIINIPFIDIGNTFCILILPVLKLIAKNIFLIMTDFKKYTHILIQNFFSADSHSILSLFKYLLGHKKFGKYPFGFVNHSEKSISLNQSQKLAKQVFTAVLN
jgi:hypothetical protein